MNNFTEIHNLCRICLTKSASMIPMHLPLNREKAQSNTPSISILEALEKVMSVKLVMNERYPSTICGMCKGLLKISHDLNTIFSHSQVELIEHFQEVLFENYVEVVPTQKVEEIPAPVELIFGKNKYDLNDVVIVEEEEENNLNYEGFLKNLGNTISARFVDKREASRRRDKSTDGVISDRYENKVQTQIVAVEDVNTNENQMETVIEISLQEIPATNNNLLAGSNVIDFIVDNNFNGENLVQELNEQNFLKNEAINKIYKCGSCNILCASRTRLKIHLKKYHIREVPYFCEACGLTTFNNNENAENEQDQDVISCEQCGAIDAKKRITNNKKINFLKNPNREVLCQFCGFISKTVSSARYHQKKHLEARFQCKICQKKYYNKSSLKWHINCHQNVRNQLCTVCGKRFNYYSALVYHMRIHSNERNYSCDFCEKKFYMPTALKRHIRTHTGIRPYGCRCCGKGFFSLGERQKHEMIHTGQRPYKCQYCNRGFISSFNRKIHYMSHSGPHECDYCQKTFLEIDFLKLHVNAKHKDNEISSS